MKKKRKKKAQDLVTVKCGACDGKGWEPTAPGYDAVLCTMCEGTGYVEI